MSLKTYPCVIGRNVIYKVHCTADVNGRIFGSLGEAVEENGKTRGLGPKKDQGTEIPTINHPGTPEGVFRGCSDNRGREKLERK